MFPVITVPDTAADLPEQLGSKPKFWFRGEDSNKYLFKEGREGTGENWAEKVAAELCGLLGLPHADYDFATWKQKKGVVTKSFVPEKGGLVHGNELLAAVFREYEKAKLYRQKQYTLRSVIAVLSMKILQPPINFTEVAGMQTAMDVFTGYLMLDAWIANQDRHHENWGLVAAETALLHLTPTYDHASSLGRNESDQTRISKLSSTDANRGMDAYVRRAVSAFYESPTTGKRLSTMEAFRYAGGRFPKAAREWLDHLGSVSSEAIEEIFGQVPGTEITEAAIRFAQALLYLNRERLLSYYKEFQ